MRTKNSLLNIFATLGSGLVIIVLNFITRNYFVHTLGIENLGLYGLFQNIIAMLAVAELGIGSAVIYHLYKPLHDKDMGRTSQLMTFYRRLYRYVAIAVATLGLIAMPFLPLLTSGVDSPVNIYVIFSLFVIDAAVSYLMSYRRSILYADQSNRLISITHLSSMIGMNLAQITLLVTTQNFYLFLLAKLTATVTENLILNYIVKRKYPNLSSDAVPLDTDTKRDVYTKTKGLLFHKLGTFFVLGTDNIIISIFLGVKYVGLYSNYLLIIEAFKSIFIHTSTAITASVGNLLISTDKRRHDEVFNRVFFLNSWVATMVSVVFFVAANNFITVWLGTEYLLSMDVIAALALNLFLTIMRTPIDAFKTAAGIFYEDRLMPVIESIINLVMSIILVQYLGILGVFIGTLCSVAFLHIYSFPKFTYTRLFERSFSSYWLMIARSTFSAVIIGGLSYWLSIVLSTTSAWWSLLVSIAISLLIVNAVMILLNFRTSEFRYSVKLTQRLLRKFGLMR